MPRSWRCSWARPAAWRCTGHQHVAGRPPGRSRRSAGLRRERAERAARERAVAACDAENTSAGLRRAVVEVEHPSLCRVAVGSCADDQARRGAGVPLRFGDAHERGRSPCRGVGKNAAGLSPARNRREAWKTVSNRRGPVQVSPRRWRTNTSTGSESFRTSDASEAKATVRPFVFASGDVPVSPSPAPGGAPRSGQAVPPVGVLPGGEPDQVAASEANPRSCRAAHRGAGRPSSSARRRWRRHALSALLGVGAEFRPTGRSCVGTSAAAG
jgi:hypothetical protein